jgi:integrase
MKGSRPLTKTEVAQVEQAFTGSHALRNRTLFVLGVNTGFRISELLSLRVRDILENDGSIADRVRVKCQYMKAKKESRDVYLNSKARKALRQNLKKISSFRFVGQTTRPYLDTPLFYSEGDLTKAISRMQALRILRAAFDRCGLRGKLGTHCLRKTFANEIYEEALKLQGEGISIDPFRTTSKALNHKSINSTDSYLSFQQSEIDDLIEKIGG